MIKALKITVLVACLANTVVGQQYSKERNVVKADNEFTKVMRDPTSGAYLRINEIGSGSRYVEEVITTNGAKYRLNVGQRALGYMSNILIAYQGDENVSEIVTYAVSEQSINEINRLTTEIPYIHVMPVLKANKVVLSNEHEGFGSVFRVYSPTLEGEVSYIPFSEGFSGGISSGVSDRIVFGANSVDQKRLKIAAFQGEDQLFEKEVATDYRSKKIYSFSDLFVVYSSAGGADRKIFGFNWAGDLLWEEQYKLPYFHKEIDIQYDEVLGRLYMITDVATLTILDSNSGALKSQIFLDQSASVKAGRLTKINYGARVVDFRMIDNILIVSLAALNKDEEPTNSYYYSDPETLVLNKYGKVLQNEMIQGNFRSFNILPYKFGFKILTDKNTHGYEKK